MTKKRNKTNQAQNAPVVEAPKQPEPVFMMKLEVIGSEPVVLNGLTAMGMSQLRQWFNGNGHSITEVPIGSSLLLLDRSKIAYMVIGEQVEEATEQA